MVVNRVRGPAWDKQVIYGPRDALLTVGREAVERLFMGHVLAEWDRAIASLEPLVPRKQRGALEDFMADAIVTAVELGLHLGAALALTGHLADSYEHWLQQAVVAAGLAGYEYSPMLDLPEGTEAYPCDS